MGNLVGHQDIKTEANFNFSVVVFFTKEYYLDSSLL